MKKEQKEKYWKLKSIERIEYEMYRSKINKETLPFFYLTLFYLKFILAVLIFIFLIVYFYGNGILSFKEIGGNFLYGILKYIWILIVCDLFMFVITPFLTNKKIKKLDKRFKLLEDKN